MAEALKGFFSPALVRKISDSIARVHPEFPTRRFVAEVSPRLDGLEFVARARLIASAMKKHLPPRYPDAVDVLVRSLGPEHATDELEGVGMAPFFYLPHTVFVAENGLDDFDVSMQAQHEMTRRFTCEWSIRPFLERYPERTLSVLKKWTRDESPHVRRLVSEGTRPRLPWAPRVPWIEREPERVLPLLEALKDDPASVVRRSVANHLNDLAKTKPDLVCDIAARWLEGASAERRALVTHALRFATKSGNTRALGLLGFGGAPAVRVADATFRPSRVPIGGKTRVMFSVTSTRRESQSLAVDLAVHFVKARGQKSPKVFKVGRVDLAGRSLVAFEKDISLAVHTTRRPYPGRHEVEVLVNGVRFPLGAFVVLANPRED